MSSDDAYLLSMSGGKQALKNKEPKLLTADDAVRMMRPHAEARAHMSGVDMLRAMEGTKSTKIAGRLAAFAKRGKMSEEKRRLLKRKAKERREAARKAVRRMCLSDLLQRGDQKFLISRRTPQTSGVSQQQNQVLNLAERGKSFYIDGPPLTGKTKVLGMIAHAAGSVVGKVLVIVPTPLHLSSYEGLGDNVIVTTPMFATGVPHVKVIRSAKVAMGIIQTDAISRRSHISDVELIIMDDVHMYNNMSFLSTLEGIVATRSRTPNIPWGGVQVIAAGNCAACNLLGRPGGDVSDEVVPPIMSCDWATHWFPITYRLTLVPDMRTFNTAYSNAIHAASMDNATPMRNILRDFVLADARRIAGSYTTLVMFPKQAHTANMKMVERVDVVIKRAYQMRTWLESNGLPLDAEAYAAFEEEAAASMKKRAVPAKKCRDRKVITEGGSMVQSEEVITFTSARVSRCMEVLDERVPSACYAREFVEEFIRRDLTLDMDTKMFAGARVLVTQHCTNPAHRGIVGVVRDITWEDDAEDNITAVSIFSPDGELITVTPVTIKQKLAPDVDICIRILPLTYGWSIPAEIASLHILKAGTILLSPWMAKNVPGAFVNALAHSLSTHNEIVAKTHIQSESMRIMRVCGAFEYAAEELSRDTAAPIHNTNTLRERAFAYANDV